MARPTEYKPDYHPEAARKLALLGKTNQEMAEAFGVSKRTIQTWLKEHDEFLHSVKCGKDLADAEVAEAFFKRATGYTYDSEKILTIAIGDGMSQVERVPITAVVLPDPGAALNWLKNRQPDKWRDKKDIGLEGELELTMILDDEKPVSDE